MACSAAVQAGVRSPSAFPAPPNVVPSRRYRSANPSSSPSSPLPSSGSGCWACQVSAMVRARTARSSSGSPLAAASSRIGVGLVPLVRGQLVGPGGDLPGPGLGDVPGGHRLGDPPVPGQPFVPGDRAAGRAFGDAGAVDQPGPGGPVPVRLIPGLGGERGQDGGVDRGQLGLRPLQPGQHLPVRRRPERRPVDSGQVIQATRPASRPRLRRWRMPCPACGSPPARDRGDFGI